jgi:hypothetical protein
MRTEAQRQYQREWVKRNPESNRASKQRYYAAHSKEIHAYRRAYRAANREKLDIQKRQWEKDNPEMLSMQRARRRIKDMNTKINGDLKYHYDITLENFNTLLEKQGGVCAICKKFEITARTKRLVVDHDHKTGRVRGILCHRCNCGIGYFKDDPSYVRTAADYLESWLRRGQFLDE